MKIAVHGLSLRDGHHKILSTLFLLLASEDIELLIYKPFRDLAHSVGIPLPDHSTYEKSSEIKQARYMISIGGDGTILDSVTYVKNKGIPIFGINLGRLGFLTAVQGEDDITQSIERLFNKDYIMEERALVRSECQSPQQPKVPFALNECAILKTDSSSMITIHASMNGQFLNSFWADGLIISTPTGSTGYNLSCGGPVVYPQSGNLVLTPVCPHNLNVRPMVIPDTAQIKLKVESRSQHFLLSLDSRSEIMSSSTQLMVRREEFKINLVKLKGSQFTETLRAKLHWGLDNRN